MNGTEVQGTGEKNHPAVPRARANPLLATRRLAPFSFWTWRCFRGYLRERHTLDTEAARWECAARWTHRWFKEGAPLLDIDIQIEGAPPAGPALIAPNHIGYLDVLAVGAACPTFFVSKADVESWPAIGRLFRSSEHIGITRADRRSIRAANEKIARRLHNGLAVCVFLEGTSTGGDKLLSFHASLVQPAVEANAPIIPVAVHWRAEHPGATVIDDIAYWREEHVFAPHAWRVAGLRGISARVVFGDPIPINNRDRKELATEARAAVQNMLGHDPDIP